MGELESHLEQVRTPLKFDLFKGSAGDWKHSEVEALESSSTIKSWPFNFFQDGFGHE